VSLDRIRILAISHLFPHEGERRYGVFTALQLAAMAKLGADITVLVPRVWVPNFLRRFKKWAKYSYGFALCEYEGLKTVAAAYPRITGNWWYRWDGVSVYHAVKKKVLALNREKRFDVIYATCLFPDGDAAVRLSKLLRVPVACLAIGTDVTLIPSYGKGIYKNFVRVVRQLDATLACGDSIAKEIDAVSDKHTLSVYGIVDMDKFVPVSDNKSIRAELGVPLDKCVAIYAGYLTKNKGVYEMVEAFCRVHKVMPNVFLNICGVGIEEEGLRQLIRKKTAGDFIRLVGDVAPEDMHKWMQASDMLILATYYEGMPNVVMEAMACGLPVVTTSVGGLLHAVGSCEGVILVPPKDVVAFEQAISKIAGDKSLQKLMGLAAREKAEQDFEVMKNAERILEHLTKLIK
jgi:glycosyltransferase involved in cell wall biosynthesis